MLTASALASTRPYLYHLTAEENISRIRHHRRLHSAARLFEDSGRRDLLRVRRRQHEVVTIGGERVVIRDQRPLHRGNVALDRGWEFEDFIELLNRQVFFWPGNADSPISYGVRHFERYRTEDVAIIRVPLLDIIAVNDEPFVCRYNSGSPRCNGGKPSPRSSQTFAPLTRSPLRPGEVVEVTFASGASLPASTTVARSLTNRWQSLF